MTLHRPVVWVHDDALAPDAPPFVRYPSAPALYVFDPDYLREEGWSLKRIGFIYECLLELPVTIRKGEPLAELRRFIREQRADGLVTTASVDPRLTRISHQLGLEMHVEILEPTPFLSHPGPYDLSRFSRYWSKAERFAYGS